MGTFGYLQPWCLVEDEEACHRVGWQTWNELQGYDINENTITLSSALMWGNNMAPSTIDPERVMQLMAWDISERCQFALGSGKQFTNRVVMMTEPVANILKKGYTSVDALENALIDNSRRSAYERAFANYYANAGGRKDGEEHSFNQYQSHIVKTEGGEETATPVWYDTEAQSMTTIPTMQKGATAFLITGDASRNKVQTLPGGGFSTVAIELPQSWDSLMAAKGYPALADMYLTPCQVNGTETSVRNNKSANTNGVVARRDYYLPSGMRTKSPRRGMQIQRNTYTNGATDVQTKMFR